MKKYVSLVLCLLLAALLFTGCAGGNGGSSGGGKTSDAAVNEALLGCFGKSADEAVKALGLKDDQKAGDYGYTLDYAWGGQTIETNLATNYGGAGVFGYAEAQKMFENSDAGTAEIKTFVEKFTAQFNDRSLQRPRAVLRGSGRFYSSSLRSSGRSSARRTVPETEWSALRRCFRPQAPAQT